MFLPSAKSPVFKVGIYRTSSIGDVVLASSCIDLLKQLKVPVQITWIGRKPSLDLISSSFPEIKAIELNKGDRANIGSEIINQLSDLHLLIDLQTSLRSRKVCKILSKHYSIPYFTCDKAQLFRLKLLFEAKVFSRGRVLPEKSLEPVALQHTMMSQTLLKGLKKYLPSDYTNDITTKSAVPRLETSHDDGSKPWQKELRFDNWLAIAPGAAHPTKRAPVDVFVKIVRETKRKYQLRNDDKCFGILVVGNQDDRSYGLSILEELSWSSQSLNLAGQLSLWETALALQSTNVLLSNDSSLGHIAESVDTNTAILFGPTIEGFGFGPRMLESKAFSAQLGCRPCSKHGKAECRFKDQQCFYDISIKSVSDHLVERLESKKH